MSKKKLSDKELIMRSGALLAEMYQVIGDAMFTLDEKRITQKEKLRVGKRLLDAADLIDAEMANWNSRLNTRKQCDAFDKALDYVNKKMKYE